MAEEGHSEDDIPAFSRRARTIDGSSSLPEQRRPQELTLKFSGKTYPSIKHPDSNEDHLAHSEPGGFAMVLDGMGGLQDGDKASSTARDYISRSLRDIPKDADPETTKRLMRNVLIQTSHRVSAEVPQGGTTATVVKFIQSEGITRAIIGSVGDSRAYLIRGSRLTQITEDDNNIIVTPNLPLAEKKAIGQKLDAVETQQDLDRLTPREQAYFKGRNFISSDLGGQTVPEPHIYDEVLQDGDRILLTTDGVHDNLSQKEIEGWFRDDGRVFILAEAALERSKEEDFHVRAKPDDISAVMVEVGRKEDVDPEEERIRLREQYQELRRQIPRDDRRFRYTESDSRTLLEDETSLLLPIKPPTLAQRIGRRGRVALPYLIIAGGMLGAMVLVSSGVYGGIDLSPPDKAVATQTPIPTATVETTKGTTPQASPTKEPVPTQVAKVDTAPAVTPTIIPTKEPEVIKPWDVPEDKWEKLTIDERRGLVAHINEIKGNNKLDAQERASQPIATVVNIPPDSKPGTPPQPSPDTRTNPGFNWLGLGFEVAKYVTGAFILIYIGGRIRAGWRRLRRIGKSKEDLAKEDADAASGRDMYTR